MSGLGPIRLLNGLRIILLFILDFTKTLPFASYPKFAIPLRNISFRGKNVDSATRNSENHTSENLPQLCDWILISIPFYLITSLPPPPKKGIPASPNTKPKFMTSLSIIHEHHCYHHFEKTESTKWQGAESLRAHIPKKKPDVLRQLHIILLSILGDFQRRTEKALVKLAQERF